MRLLSGLFSLIVVALFAWTFWVPVETGLPSTENMYTPILAPAVRASNVIGHPLARYAAIAERPVFSVTRKSEPNRRGSENKRTNQIEQQQNLVARGVVLSAKEAQVLLVMGENETGFWISEGETVDNIEVVEVSKDTVRLKVSGRSINLPIGSSSRMQETPEGSVE